MEQYILDWLKEHPEARNYVSAAWAFGYAAGSARAVDVLVLQRGEEPAPVNPFAQPQEVKAA